MAYPGEVPVFSGQDVHYPINIDGASYIILDGLSFDNNFRHLKLEAATHIIVRNCSFGKSLWVESTESYRADWSGVRVWNNSQYNKFLNCVFRDWGYVGINWSDVGTAFGLGNWSDENDQTWYNLIESCVFSHAGHDNLSIGTAYNVIRNNYFHNENWMDSPETATTDPKGFGLEKWGNRIGEFDGRRVERNLIENNRFMYSGVPPDQDRGGFGIELGMNQTIIRNNVVAYSWASGIYLVGESAENYIYHNTIWRNSRPEDHNYPLDQTRFAGGIIMSNYQIEKRPGNRIVNNIIFDNGYRDISSLVEDHQIVRQNFTTSSGDPRFVNEGGFGDYEGVTGLPDLHLRSESPAIDAGDWLAFIVSPDGSGNSFIVDDAGYFSDGNRIVDGDRIQLQGQTETARITRVDYITNEISIDRSLSWNSGLGVALEYRGGKPDMGAFESNVVRYDKPSPPTGLAILP
jgi:parallel beta-helix repeat protein